MVDPSKIFVSNRAPSETDLDGQKVRLIRNLLDSLSSEARLSLLNELTADVAIMGSKSPTGVLATVLKLLPRGQTVTAADLRQQLEERGVEAHPKEIYNAIGYLARTGALKRIGYGRYTIHGVEISTADNLGGEPDRLEDLSDDT